MNILYLGESRDLLLPIPGSSSGDTVTYEIFNSAGSVIQSGSMTFVRDEIWKVAGFTPASVGMIILKGNDTTIGQKRENEYHVRPSSEAAVPDDSTVPTSQQILDNVRKAINAKLTGGAVQSYSISGRNIQNYSLDELLRLEKVFMDRVDAEAGGTRNYVKFVNPD